MIDARHSSFYGSVIKATMRQVSEEFGATIILMRLLIV